MTESEIQVAVAKVMNGTVRKQNYTIVVSLATCLMVAGALIWIGGERVHYKSLVTIDTMAEWTGQTAAQNPGWTPANVRRIHRDQWRE